MKVPLPLVRANEVIVAAGPSTSVMPARSCAAVIVPEPSSATAPRLTAAAAGPSLTGVMSREAVEDAECSPSEAV